MLSLLVLLQRGSPCDFAPKTRDSAQGYIQCMPLHIGDPVLPTDVQTDGQTYGHVTITSLSKFLGFIGYQICLAMVLRQRAKARAPLQTRPGSCSLALPIEKSFRIGLFTKRELNFHRRNRMARGEKTIMCNSVISL